MLPSFTTDLAGGLTAVVLYGAVAWSGYLGGASLVPRSASTAVRLAAGALIAAWLLVAAFWLLVPFGGFRLPVGTTLFATLAIALHLACRDLRPRSLVRRDLRNAWGSVTHLTSRPSGWALGFLFLVSAVRTLRGSASPPLGWDALTYHLYKAGRWVQLGDLAPQPAPDAWSYYEYFPVVGDVLWAWAMLPLRSDLLIPPAGLALWLCLFLGIYAAGRELDATPERSALAAGAVCAMPSVLPYLSSGYVDNTVAAFFALGSLFTVRLWRGGPLREAPLAIGALGLMVGTKLTAAGFFAVGAVLVLVAVLRRPADARTRRLVLLALLAAAAVGYSGYQRAWVEQGSPFHPFRIVFGDAVLSEGVEAAAGLAEEIRSWPRYELESAWDFWRLFFLAADAANGSLNPGPGGLLILGLGLVGGITALRDPRRRVAALFLGACALLMLAGFLSGNMETFRTTLKVTTAGRYVTVGFVAMAILGAAWPAPVSRTLWSLALLTGTLLSLPQGWAAVEAPAIVAVGSVALFWIAGLAATVWWWRGTGRPALSVATAVVVTAVALSAGEAVRSPHRYSIYQAAADPADPVFHMHALHSRYAAAWGVWQALDEQAPHRLAVTAGWDGLGHNWYRYPLLGSRLQNRVLYVPVTEDGRVVDYRAVDDLVRRASFPAWLARIVEADVDHVVSLAPRTTVEDFWMQQAPEVFEPVIAEPRGLHVAYRFDRDAARELLEAGARPPDATSHTRSTAPPGPRAPGSRGTADP
ncbi:MAG: hypothetical protein ACLF0P_09260 [Thermoanaerobaculia bacterium]